MNYKKIIFASALLLFIFVSFNIVKAQDSVLPINQPTTLSSITSDLVSALQNKINEIKLQIFTLQLNNLKQKLLAQLTATLEDTLISTPTPTTTTTLEPSTSTIDPGTVTPTPTTTTTTTPTATTTPTTTTIPVIDSTATPIATQNSTSVPVTTTTLAPTASTSTQEQINATAAQIQNLQSVLNGLTKAVPNLTAEPTSINPLPNIIPKPVILSDENTIFIDSVESLQSFLISMGYSIPAGPTGIFGNQTKTAFCNFEIKELDLSPVNPHCGNINGPWALARMLEKGIMVGSQYASADNAQKAPAKPSSAGSGLKPSCKIGKCSFIGTACYSDVNCGIHTCIDGGYCVNEDAGRLRCAGDADCKPGPPPQGGQFCGYISLDGKCHSPGLGYSSANCLKGEKCNPVTCKCEPTKPPVVPPPVVTPPTTPTNQKTVKCTKPKDGQCVEKVWASGEGFAGCNSGVKNTPCNITPPPPPTTPNPPGYLNSCGTVTLRPFRCTADTTTCEKFGLVCSPQTCLCVKPTTNPPTNPNTITNVTPTPIMPEMTKPHTVCTKSQNSICTIDPRVDSRVNTLGFNECTSNANCVNKTHSGCINNGTQANPSWVCKKDLPGRGIDVCKQDKDCTLPPHGECFNNTCRPFYGIGIGPNSCILGKTCNDKIVLGCDSKGAGRCIYGDPTKVYDGCTGKDDVATQACTGKNLLATPDPFFTPVK